MVATLPTRALAAGYGVAARLTSCVRPDAGAPMPCKHCGAKTTRNRGLCKPCYYDPEIRGQYPRLTTEGRKVPRRGKFTRNLYGLAVRPVPAPTYAEPGSEAKIAVLVARFEARQQLWNPLDAKLPAGRPAITADREVRATFGD